MATITVTTLTDAGLGSLREAIASAIAGDSIVFDPSLQGGTINFLSTISILKKVTITGNIRFTGNSQTVKLFYVERGISFSLNGVTLEDAKTAIHTLDYAKITLNQVTVRNNKDSLTGAIYIGFGVPIIILNSVFEANDASTSTLASTITGRGGNYFIIEDSNFYNNVGVAGGCVYGISSKFKILQCHFENNLALGSTVTGKNDDSGGGALYLDGYMPAGNTPHPTLPGLVIIQKCTFVGNKAYSQGGAMMLYGYWSDRAKITDCVFKDNEVFTSRVNGVVVASARGGALRLMAHADITNCSFINNKSEIQGGAIWSINGDFRVYNCTFGENKTLRDAGGAVFAIGNPNPVEFFNCTFSDNDAGFETNSTNAPNAQGGMLWYNGSLGKFTNCITKNNTGNTANKECAITVSSGGGNFQFPANNRLYATGATVVDPLLQTLTQLPNGQYYYPLDPASPALGSGVNLTALQTPIAEIQDPFVWIYPESEGFGNDTITSPGDAFVFGGYGNDRLIASTKNNLLNGAAGNNIFVFSKPFTTNSNMIVGMGDTDKIDISQIVSGCNYSNPNKTLYYRVTGTTSGVVEINRGDSDINTWDKLVSCRSYPASKLIASKFIV